MGLKPGEVDLGTTIMAVKFDGGVVLGADTRTSMGVYVVNRVADKITPLHNKIFCCRSGSAADTQALADIVSMQLSSHAVNIGRKPTVKTAAALFQRFCYQYKEQMTAGIIIAGYDDQRGPSVYTIPLGGTCVEQDYAIGGSGSTFIYGYCDAHYKKDMKEADAVQFVKKAISHAMHRDGSSGGCVRTMVITSEKNERGFTDGDKLPFPVLPSKADQI